MLSLIEKGDGFKRGEITIISGRPFYRKTIFIPQYNTPYIYLDTEGRWPKQESKESERNNGDV